MNTTWTSGGSPYLASNIQVDSGVTLTINPGVVVKFDGVTGMRVDGTLAVAGLSGSHVVFTSIADDAADSIDSNSDGASVGAPADWTAIVFVNGGSSTVDFAEVRFGGYGNTDRYGQLEVDDGTLTITDSTVEKGGCSGIAVETNQRLTATRVKVSANGFGCGGDSGNGINSFVGYSTISDSAIVENAGYGVAFTVADFYSAGSPPTLDDSLVWWNGLAGVKLDQNAGTSTSIVPDGSGNNIFDNGVFVSFADRMTQIETDYMPGADWTGNYWGEAVQVETCPSPRCHGGAAPATHVNYGLSVPFSIYPNRLLGPIRSTDDAWELHHPLFCGYPFDYGQPDGPRYFTGVCPPAQDMAQASADNVDGSSPSLFPFSNSVMTAPQPLGIPTVSSLFGCTECAPGAAGIASGQSPTQSAVDPVNTATGTLSETLTDASLAGPGTPFEWTRSYNSRDATSGRLGVGWVDQYDASLEIDGGGNVTYRSGAGQVIPFAALGDGTYVARSFTGSLTKTGGGDYLLVTQDQRTFEFDSSGFLTSITPLNLPATTLTYTSSKLTSITDSAGRTITITYKSATPSLIDRVTLPDSRFVQFDYDDSRIATVHDLRGKEWHYGYDANGYLDEIENPESELPLSNTYDADGRVLTQTDGSGNITTFTYSSAPDNLGFDHTTVTVPDRGATVYRYSALILNDVTDPLDNRTSYAYDRNFRLTSITNARGKTRSFEYDARGNLTSDADANNDAIVRTYNADDQLLTEEDRRGHTTTSDYCDTSTCSAHSTTYLKGQLESITDRESGERVFKYIQAGGATPAATVGQIASVTDERGKTTAYEYDTDGNLASITTPLGFVTSMTYDGSGRLETQRDARGNVPMPPAGFLTTWTYEDDDQVESVETPTQTTSYTYDDAGRLAQKTTPDGDWTYTYDEASRPTSIEDPKGGLEHYTFDDAGGVVGHETPGGALTTYTYDTAGRVATLREPLGNVDGASPTDESDHTWTYGYDEVGNITSLTHPDAGTTYTTYNDVNLPIQWTDARSNVTEAGYDENYNLTSRTDAYDVDETYTYDDLDRLETTTDRNGKTTTLTYFATGQRESLTTATGAERTWSLDDDGRVDAMVDPRGNELGATPANYTWAYEYDEVGNLVLVTDPLDNETARSYDAANNLASMTDARGKTTDYAVDEMDRVTSVTPPAAGASSPLATTNTYDELGRLTERTDPNGHSTSAAYDADGMVTRSTTAATITDYSYDANHNLVLQETRPTSGETSDAQVAPSDALSPPVVDDFNRSNTGPPLSPSWNGVVNPGDAGAEVSGNEAVGASGVWSDVWPQGLPASQDVRVTLTTLMGNGKSTALYTRIQDSDSSSVTGYALTLAQNSTPGSDSWAISRIDSSTSTTTLATNATGADATAGLELRLVAHGSTLTGYALVGDEWVEQVTTTDATYAPSSSFSGLGGEDATGALDDFRSSEYVGDPALLDDFDRSDEGPPPSADWGSVVRPGDDGMQVTSNQASGETGSWSQLWDAPLGPDQDIEATLATPMGSGNWMYLYARVRDADTSQVDGYVLKVVQSSFEPGVDTWSIVRVDDDTETTLVTNENAAEAASGLRMRFVVRGAQLTGYALVDGVWTEQVHTADTTYDPPTSRVGLRGSYTAGRFDDFHAGQLMPAPSLLDDFNRSDEGPPPSDDWGGVARSGDEGVEVDTNQASGSSGSWSQLWDETFGPDQDIEATLATPMGSGNWAYLYGRIRNEGTGNANGYFLKLVQSSFEPGVDTWSIVRIDDDTETTLSSNEEGAEATAGLRMRFVLRGSTLVGYAFIDGAWVRQVGAIDTTYRPGASRVGIHGAYGTGRFDNFRAEQIARSAPLLDTFNRPDDGPPPSSDWGDVVLPGDEGVQIRDNQASGDTGSWSQLWSEPLGPEQEAEITLNKGMGSGNWTELYTRIQDADSADVHGYYLVLIQSHWDPNIDTWEIHRLDDDATDTTLATNDNGAPALPGLRMRFVAHGTTLTGYALIDGQWVEQVTTNDSTYRPAVSRVGIHGAYSAGRLDDFRAHGNTTTTYAYDRMNRLTGIDYSGSSTPDVAYQYDNAGLRQEMNDGAGAETYDYNDNNQVTAITRAGSDDGTDGVMSYGYDDAGNIDTRTYPDTTSLTATYTDDEQLETITNAGDTTTFAYDTAGNLTSTTLPSGNGYVETRSYDEAGRLDDIKSTASGPTTLDHYALTLDENGAPTRVALTRDATTSYQAFQYDDRSRLTDACYDITSIATDCTGATEQITYTYDKASNRTSQTRAGITDAGTTNYTYNPADQLTSTTTSTGTTPYAYDDRGNQTSDGTTTSTYNVANQLASSTSAATTTSYGYDGDGKRLSTDTADGPDLRYTWDPLAVTGMPELAHERLPDGTPVRTYTTGPTGPLSFTNDDDTYYYHHDWQGSTSDITDSTGTPQWAYDYEPYGTLRNAINVSSVAPENPLLYTGQYLDSQTNNYHLRARQYDPTAGRFLSTDPLGQPTGMPAAGAYDYVNGRPTTLYDPRGLFPDVDLPGVDLPSPGEIANGGLHLAQSAGNAAGGVVEQGVDYAEEHPYKAAAYVGAGVAMAAGQPGVAVLLISVASAQDAYDTARTLKDCKDAWCALKASGQLALYVAPIPAGSAARVVIKLGSKRLARVVTVRASTGAESSLQGALLREDLRLTEKYGSNGVRHLENGSRRYYGDLRPSQTPGEMAGQRTVREWNPTTGDQRTWLETLDQQGRVRIVRPVTGGPKTHHYFDQQGGYVGSR